MMIKSTSVALLTFFCSSAISADWDSYPVPVDAGTGYSWVLQDQSDDFNYNFAEQSSAATINNKWTNFYHNQWDGPGPTKWRHENTSVWGGDLRIKASRVAGEKKSFEVDTNLDGVNEVVTMNATRAGCITSKTRVKYPVFVEARVKIANAVMASDVWMLSPDDTQEIDILENYSNVDYFKQFTHRIFLQNSF